jgi:phospholipase/carboxylesterase
VTPIRRLDLAGLTTRIFDPPGAVATCVLLHGFGAPGDDLVGLAPALAALAAPIRFVFPAAPLDLTGGYGDARAWWMIDLARFERPQASGAASERRREIPDGLPEARAQMLLAMSQLQAKFSIPADRLVLGGFSQGAMLSLDVALHLPARPAGLLLMSGTLIAEPVWQPRLSTLAGVPVMQSHGREDAILPFDVAELLRDRLIAAGAVVDWQPFSGGHAIPPSVVDAAGALLDACTR